MPELSLDLSRRIVAAYRSGRTKTYDATAEMFGVGRATVNRLLRRQRETGDLHKKPRGGNNPRRIDLDWLRQHAEAFPDARLKDRAEAWAAKTGESLSITAIWSALRALGITHKKRLSGPKRENSHTFKRGVPST